MDELIPVKTPINRRRYPKALKTRILAAGSGDRNQKEFAREFKALAQVLDKQFETVKLEE